MRQAKKQTTITFQPTPEAESLISKAIIKKVGRHGNARGLRTRFINEAIQDYLKTFAGKREAAL